MFEEIRNQVLKQARLAETLGLCQSGGGNFSMIDRESGMVCMTPHDTDRFQMSWRDVLVTDLEGNVLEKGPGLKPTSEIEIHLAVYRAREDILAVAHTHAPYTSVFAGLSMEVKPVLTEAMTYYGRAPLAPFGTPSTPQLAENIVKTLGEKGVAAVMEKRMKQEALKEAAYAAALAVSRKGASVSIPEKEEVIRLISEKEGKGSIRL